MTQIRYVRSGYKTVIDYNFGYTIQGDFFRHYWRENVAYNIMANPIIKKKSESCSTGIFCKNEILLRLEFIIDIYLALFNIRPQWQSNQLNYKGKAELTLAYHTGKHVS